MAKEILKDVAVRNAKSTDKDYRLSDGEGLYVLIKTNGAKWWRFNYTFSVNRKTLSRLLYIYRFSGCETQSRGYLVADLST